MRTHGMCALGDAIQVPWKEQIDLRPYGEAFPPLSTHARSSMEDGPFMEDGGSQSVPPHRKEGTPGRSGRNSWCSRSLHGLPLRQVPFPRSPWSDFRCSRHLKHSGHDSSTFLLTFFD